MSIAVIKNRELVATFNALSNLGKLPKGLISLKVARVVGAVMPHARDIERQHRDLIEEYSSDEPGRIAPDRISAFRTAEREMMDADTLITVPFLTPADLDEVAQKTELDPGLVAFLLPFVTAPPEAA